MIRLLLVFLMLSYFANAQERREQPLILISKKPLALLDKDVKGWSYSLDGQWLSAKKKIPIRANSRDKDIYDKKPEYLGIDNFSYLALYPAIYGVDTLMLMVKVYKDGAYKFGRIKKNWDEYYRAYYYLLSKKEYKKLDMLQDTSAQVIKLDLVDDGEISGVDEGDIMNEIRSRLRVNQEHHRQMVVMVQPFTAKNRIRFQIFSQHKIFRDVAGVLRDFTLMGNSLYGDLRLFDYLYYETAIDRFEKLMTVPNSFDFKM